MDTSGKFAFVDPRLYLMAGSKLLDRMEAADRYTAPAV
jgi:hypothetical protein